MNKCFFLGLSRVPTSDSFFMLNEILSECQVTVMHDSGHPFFFLRTLIRTKKIKKSSFELILGQLPESGNDSFLHFRKNESMKMSTNPLVVEYHNQWRGEMTASGSSMMNCRAPSYIL